MNATLRKEKIGQQQYATIVYYPQHGGRIILLEDREGQFANTRLATREVGKLLDKLEKIEQEIEGVVDGAPDASPSSKLANKIVQILES